MSERVWRKLKMCALKKSLATGSRDWQVTKGGTRVKHAEELKGYDNWSTTGQNFQSGQAVSSWLKLVTRFSREVKSLECSVWLKLTFRISHTHYYKYPYPYEMLRVFRENFERETLEKNKIDLSTIFIFWFSKFLYSHLFHWHILERYI